MEQMNSNQMMEQIWNWILRAKATKKKIHGALKQLKG